MHHLHILALQSPMSLTLASLTAGVFSPLAALQNVRRG